jgi:hypothetical protein
LDLPTGNSNFAPVVRQNGQDGDRWQSASLASPYTLASPPPSTLQPIDENAMAFSHNGLPEEMSNYNFEMPWNENHPSIINAPSDTDNISMSDFHFGSYGSFGSVDSMALGSPNTAASSMSEAYVFPVTGSPFGSPRGMSQLGDLKLQGTRIWKSQSLLCRDEEVAHR